MKDKLLLSVILVGLMVVNLSGCASFKALAARQKTCVDSPVLYTDLTRPARIRNYELSNGND